MRQVCKFDSNRDIQKSVPGLSTSISLALESGVVLDTGIDSVHNDIDNPANIWCRITDVFSAIDAQKKVLNSGQQVSPSVSPSQPATGGKRVVSLFSAVYLIIYSGLTQFGKNMSRDELNTYKWLDAEEVRPRTPLKVNKEEIRFQKYLQQKLLDNLELL